MNKIIFDLKNFSELIEDFVVLDRKFSDFELSYKDILTALIVGASYSHDYNTTPFFNGLLLYMQEYYGTDVSTVDEQQLFKLATAVERFSSYRDVYTDLRAKFSKIDCGAMYSPSDITVDFTNMVFIVAL